MVRSVSCVVLALLSGIVPHWRDAAIWGAIYAFVSQIVAVTIHINYCELHSLPANGQWKAMAAMLYAACIWTARKERKVGEPA